MRTVNMMSLQEFDELVEKTYNKPYSFQQQDGCKKRGTYKFSLPMEFAIEKDEYENNSVPEVANHHEMGVSFEAWLARDPKQPLDGNGDPSEASDKDWNIRLWWDRNFYPHVDMVLDDLYNKGLLKAGDYVIDIDW